MESPMHHATPQETPVPPEVKEIISEALMEAATSPGYPAYSEENLHQRARRAARAELYVSLLANERFFAQATDPVGVPGGVTLTEDEHRVLDLCLQGYRLREIAQKLQRRRREVIGLLASAGRRIRAGQSPFHGLPAVYHDEVHRRTYRKPMHCEKKPCTKLGYCRYALGGRAPKWR